MKISKSFIKYCIGGGLKTIMNLFLLWLFIDYMTLTISNTIVRTIIFGVSFILTYYIYKWIGFTNSKEV